MSTADPAAAFAALGDRTRLALVTRLAGGAALSIAALSVDTGLTRQAVAKHLAVLASARLVSSTRSGRESRYVLLPDRLADLGAYLAAVEAGWDAALGRLRDFVDGEADG